jgi:hypothetical protein
MRRILIPLLLLSVTLFGCAREPADLAPDELPQVAIANINGVDVRNSGSNKVYVPSSSIYPVGINVTASDETLVGTVELFLNNQSVGKLEPKTVDGKPTDFKNPFKFTVGTFTGTAGEATPATLRAVATDNKNQTNEYELEVLVDSTPPVVNITSLTGLAGGTPGSFQGSVVISGVAFDPESSIAIDAFAGAEVRAYLDGDPNKVLNLAGDTKTPQTAFTTVAEGLVDGAHFVTLFARNSAGVFSSTTSSLIINTPKTTPTTP